MNERNRAAIHARLALLSAVLATGCGADLATDGGEAELGTTTAALSNCSEFTASVSAHASAGRAYSTQQGCGSGSNQTAFSDPFATLSTTSWIETGEGDWTTGARESTSGYGAGGAPVAHVDNCNTECTIELRNAINLTGKSSATLSFWRFVDSEFDSTDYLRVELYNGSSWVRIFSWTAGNGNTNTWRQEVVDLSSYLNVSNFKVRFIAKTSLFSEDAQLDDVVITTTTPPPACTSWFATGSNEPLGTNGSATVTLHSTEQGTWSTGACPLCGNGEIDPGETCDGNCPTSCSDSSACTTDTLTGSAESCNAACTHAPITTCAGGDGCCPAGCNAANDNNCATICGNGAIDPGERCDGNCPTSCNDQNACTIDVLAGSALLCDARCVHAALTVCRNGDGCCPSGCTAANDNDCVATSFPCQGFTSTVSAHVSAGRAYSQLVFFTRRYYATGSNESLGTSSTATLTLYANGPNFYSRTQGTCACSCAGKACGATDGCGKECSGPCSGFNQCVDTTGTGNYECLAGLPALGDPTDGISASLVAANNLTLAIQQLIELQAELATVPNSQQAIGELQQRQAELESELDTVQAQGNLQ